MFCEKWLETELISTRLVHPLHIVIGTVKFNDWTAVLLMHKQMCNEVLGNNLKDLL